jgi:hypothetical protein
MWQYPGAGGLTLSIGCLEGDHRPMSLTGTTDRELRGRPFMELRTII